MNGIRLQKIIAESGFASRRKAEEMILAGRVRVNGKVVAVLGSRADPNTDEIEVEGIGRIKAEPKVFIALYKPQFVITSMSDPEGRATVAELLLESRAVGQRMHEDNLPRVVPVGRLDYDAEGLLLLSNDGELANRLMHPRFHVPKTYVVKIKGKPEEKSLERMRQGIRLREENGRMGRRTKPAEARIVRQSPSNTWIELVITEGRHHQIKRMCEAVGHRVIRLVRSEFGHITLDGLKPGAWRFLTPGEIAQLQNWSSGS